MLGVKPECGVEQSTFQLLSSASGLASSVQGARDRIHLVAARRGDVCLGWVAAATGRSPQNGVLRVASAARAAMEDSPGQPITVTSVVAYVVQLLLIIIVVVAMVVSGWFSWFGNLLFYLLQVRFPTPCHLLV